MANNDLLYNGAFTGAVFGAANRVYTQETNPFLPAIQNAAAAFATAVDALIPPGLFLDSDAGLMQSLCSGLWQSRFPVKQNSDYANEAAEVAVYFATLALGILPTPPVPPGSLPLSSIEPIAADSIVANPTGALASPQAVLLNPSLAFLGGVLSLNETGALSLVGNPSGSPAVPLDVPLNGTLEFNAGALRRAALTGQVTAPAGSNVTTIGNNQVTLANLVQPTASQRLLGRGTGAPGNFEELGIGGGLGFPSPTSIGINDNGVSNARLADMATLTLKGNNTGGTTDPIDLSVAQVLAMLGLTKGAIQNLCVVRSAGGQSFTAASGFELVTAWDTELVKTVSGMHSTSTNPSRLITSAVGTFVVFWTWNASQNGANRIRDQAGTSLQDRATSSTETGLGFFFWNNALNTNYVEMLFDIAVNGSMTTSPPTACTFGLISLNIP